MILTLLPPDATLGEVLRDRARRTPLDRLAIDVAGGGLVAVASLWARFPWWGAVASAAVCMGAYGVWAIADRKLLPLPWPERQRHEGTWRFVEGAAGVIGIASFVSFLVIMLGLLLGPIKS